MKIKVLISLEGAKSNTEVSFYERVQYAFPELYTSDVFPMDPSNKTLEADVKNIIHHIQLSKEQWFTNHGSELNDESIEAELYFMWDNGVEFDFDSYFTKLSSMLKTKMDSSDIIKEPIIAEKGFEMGVINLLFKPPHTSIKQLVQIFGYSDKDSFKNRFTNVLGKAQELTGLNSSNEIHDRLKENNCSHYKIFIMNN